LTIKVFLMLFMVSCNNHLKTNTGKSVQTEKKSQGYNELANTDKRNTFSISDFNTDDPEIKNIERPSLSTIKTDLDTTLLFGIWTSDPDGPHADFELTSKSFYVVDYDGNGDMPYELSDRNIKIYYNDFIQEGKVISVDKDTLKINWKDFDIVNSYERWKQ
jgi:hypothetical protein